MSSSKYGARYSESFLERSLRSVQRKGNLVSTSNRCRKSSLSMISVCPSMTKRSQLSRQARGRVLSDGRQFCSQQSAICPRISQKASRALFTKIPEFRNRIQTLSKLFRSLRAALEYFRQPSKANSSCSRNTSFYWLGMSAIFRSGWQLAICVFNCVIFLASSPNPQYYSNLVSSFSRPARKSRKILPQMHPSCESSMQSSGSIRQRYFCSRQAASPSLFLGSSSSNSRCRAISELMSRACSRLSKGPVSNCGLSLQAWFLMSLQMQWSTP